MVGERSRAINQRYDFIRDAPGQVECASKAHHYRRTFFSYDVVFTSAPTYPTDDLSGVGWRVPLGPTFNISIPLPGCVHGSY